MDFKVEVRFVRDRFTWLAYYMLAYYAYLQAALGPLMPFLRTELGLSYTSAGFHFSAFALGMILGGLTADRIARRRGRRLAFWGGAIGLALAAIGLVVSDRIALTIAATLAMGILGTLLLVMIQATLSDRHGDQRVIALTESNLAASFSAMTVPFLIGLFQSLGIGWRVALLLAVAVLALVAVRYWHVDIPLERNSIPGSKQHEKRLPAAYWAYWLVTFLAVASEWCLVFWGAEFLINEVGLESAAAAATMSIFFLAMVVGRFTGSRLARRLPTLTLLLIAFGLALAGSLVFWLARPAAFSIGGLFLAGLGVANLYPFTLSLATGAAPEQSNTASARLSLASGLAILLAPFLLGWAADQVTIQRALGLVVLLFILAIAVTALTRNLQREPRPVTLATPEADES